MRLVHGVAIAALALAISACSGQQPPATQPDPAPTAQQPDSRTTSTPITAIDAYSFCRALLTSRLGYDRSLTATADSPRAAQITAIDNTFEVALHGPTPAGSGTTFCVLSGTLGDPQLLYTGDLAAWAEVRASVLAAHSDRVIDSSTVTDKNTPIDSLLGWATCRVLRLAVQPPDYAAGWTDFNSTDLTRGRQGIEVYEVFPAGKADAPPIDTSSFCVIDGTLANPYPVVYIERGPGQENARDYYGDMIADAVDRSL